MGKKIIWSPAAEGDLENVLDFLDTKWSSRIALRFLKKLDNVIELISEDPKLFPLIHKKMGVRKCVVTKQNSLYYRENKQSIEIIRLIDTRQDPKKLKY